MSQKTLLETGDSIVAEKLACWGFNIKLSRIANLEVLEVSSSNSTKIVYVVSATYPNEPLEPSLTQRIHLIKYSRTINAEVWIARVQLNQNPELQSLSWSRIHPQ